MEQYNPIRVQGFINDTLRSVLDGKERRRLELYDSEKAAILYKNLVADDGTGRMTELMRDLHERA